MKQFLSLCLRKQEVFLEESKHNNNNLRRRYWGFSLLVIGFLLLSQGSKAQVSGRVFRDFDADGARDSTSNHIKEVGLAGVTVTAYNAVNASVGSATTGIFGTYTITGVSGTVRIEFTGLQTGDFSSKAGGTSVQFVTAPATNVNFAVNYPADYNTGAASTNAFVPSFFNGDATATPPGSTAGIEYFMKFPYSNSGTTAPSATMTGEIIGATNGTAYSRHAQTIFAAAFVKRHIGLGTLGSGGIYKINSNLTSATPFYNLDANGYPTRCASGCPTYGSGSSFNVTINPDNSQTLSFIGNGLGVVGANGSGGRNLPKNLPDPSNDAAAFDQVGKVGLGDAELSEDGQYLFVVNLFDQQIYRLTLNNPSSPTSVTAVTSYGIPTPPLRSASGIPNAANTYTGANNGTGFYDGTLGHQRPFALKVHRGKLYIGTVTTGENGGISTKDNNTGNPEYTDLWAYVWVLDLATGTFSSSPALQFPLNFDRGTNGDLADETFKPWTRRFQRTLAVGNNWSSYYYSQAMFTDIEFDVEGSMILGFRDRYGDQGGYANYQLTGTTSPNNDQTVIGTGEILRAYFNLNTSSFELETNGKEGINSPKAATAGAGNGQGPGGGEFYYQDNETSNSWHTNVSMGSLSLLPGRGEVITTSVDPISTWSGGTRRYRSADGTRPNNTAYQLYIGADIAISGKSNGLGDIELMLPLAPLEIGNRIWADTDSDGIQDADEAGVDGVTVQLYEGATLVGSTTAASGGQYYFNNSNVIQNGATELKPNTAYTIRVPSASFPSGQSLTTANVGGAGQPDARDSDASLVSGNAEIAFNTGNYGENNHTYDIGFRPACNLSAVGSGTNVSCNGGSNGTATVTVSGNLIPVTYLWSNGATTQSITGLEADTYSVTVTETSECTAVSSYQVTQPPVLTITCNKIDVSITNGSDGAINVTVGGGTPLYTYLWNDGATAEDRTGLSAGTYSVTVTDANGCTTSCSTTLTEPPCALTLSISAEDALCNGDANGTINLTINGAQGSVQILWNDGATTEDRTGLTAGTYSVTVTDGGNCTATTGITVDEPEVLGMTGTVSNVTITEGSDGSINVTVTGGTTPYTYLWSDGATTQDRSGLTAGTYSVTVTDANGCEEEASFTITEPPCALTLSISAEDALCNGDANGTINLTITGAQGSVQILWNDGATTEDRTGLSAGTYSVTVTDGGNCTATTGITVDEPAVLGMTGTVSNVTITEGNDGSINVTVTGGTTPYTYLWSDGATTQDRSGLTAGTYSVTVTDANGCEEEASFTITEPPCALTLSISAEDALCNGDANGTINLTITGAQGSVQILWNDGATTEDRTGLSAGTYSVTVTDGGNCTATTGITVDEPEVLGMTGTVSNVTITEGNDGSINVTVTGGTTPYTYLWSDGATTQDRSGLTAGTYSVTVTDANGCEEEASFTITEPPCALTLSISAEDALCNGDANGTINLTINGAQGSVQILWNDGATSEDRTGLSAGTYSVTVTDSGNCEATISVTVNEPVVLGMTGSVTNVTITGGSDGTISVTVTGGTTPYSYLWSDGSTSEDRTNLPSGTYTVTVTDANGCSLSQSFSINEPGCGLSLSITAEDALCNGDANGTINLTITGAQGSVQILWNDGATSEDRTGLSAGTYSVTVTDSGNCEATISVTVNEPDVLGMTGSVTNVTITGGSDGTISVTVTGGTTPYSYLWSDGSTSEDRTNLTSGNYAVTVTDANGCSLSQSFSINEPGCTLALSIDAEDALCNGDANGTINLTITGAQGSVQILWNDGATSEDRTGLSAGTYSVTVTDSGNCEATISVTVNEPDVLGMTGSVTNVTITGGSDGTISVTVTGGTTPYSYLWSDGSTSEDRTNLTSGNYTVTVTDANGCSLEQSFSINEPGCALALSITAEDALCNGDANGTIDLTITGAQGSVQILWNDGATSEDRTGLSAGTYSVTVTDSGNCEATISVTVNEPAVLGMTGSVTNVTITGGSDGTISVTVTGGTTPYSYLWSDGSTSEDRTNLTSGNYAVTVTDANGCSLSQSFTINEPGCALALSITAEDALCNGDANGTIDLTITGAQGSVSILWNDGATSEDRTGLSAGTYSVTVTDSGNCEATISVTVNEPAVLGMTGSVTNVTITGGNDGTISVTVTGGTAPYTYLWSDGSTSEDRTNLTSGNYAVTVTDANGCSLSQSFTINEPGCALALSITAEDALCNGDANGTIDLTITGAQGSVSILWNDGATSEDRTGLSAGTYSVTVTDSGNCEATISVTVNEPVVLGMTGSVTNVTITGGSDGTISVTVTGGTTPYSYLWSDGSTSEDRTNLPSGTYTVTVTDANGCSLSQSFSINEPGCGLSLSITAEDALCNGDANGTINLTITGAQGSVQILWNDGATSEDRTGLSAGTYSVTVTDSGNCEATISVTVNEPAVLGMTGSVTNVTITGGSDGTISVTVTGGTTPYSYLWSDGSTSEDRTNLTSGNYAVTVTDANGCSLSQSFTINEPGCALALSITAEDALCNGDANGTIDLTITGAQGSVSILWNDGATSEDRTGLSAGTYSVTVTDSGNCEATISVTVNEPAVLGMTGSVTNVTITGGSDGTISVTVTGGTTPYSYLWSDGSTSEDRTNLTSGNYAVTVTDANGCSLSQSFTINEPGCALALSITAEDALCNGDANGTIDLTITGAQGSVSILWNDGATSEDRTGLSAGTYSVTVTDSGNCEATISVTVNEPAVLGMTGSVTNVTITGGNDGTISVTVTGGTAPYTYLWSDGSTSEDRTNLTSGNYAVTVTDANGCSLEQSFSINEPGCALALSITAEDALCNGDANGTIDLTITGAQGSVQILWNDGATSEDRTGLSAGTYSVTVTDSGNCEATISVTVNEPAVLGMTGSVTNVTITGGSDGTISVTVTGGTAPYTYLWSDGSTSEDRTNLPSGTYTVTVTDANGCSLSQSFSINEPGCTLALSIDAEDALCNGDANGTINLTITGAQGSVSILWNDGATSEDRTGLSAGTYSVTVTDSGNCEATISVTVNEPAVLGMTGSVTNVTITGGSDGTISVTVTGGTAPYSYLWSDGSTSEDRTNLPSGTYTVTVTDANGCSLSQSFSINEPGCTLALSIDAEDALCNGDANGTINLTITGAQGSVQILWNDGATSEDRTGLSAGTYSVTVTDSGNCEATISVTVNEPAVLGMTGSVTNVTITGGSDGTISFTVTGGTAPYTYLWSDGSTSEDRTNLTSGNYTVTVTDANGCSLSQSFSINEPGCTLALSIDAEDALCNGDANGTIDLTITGAQGSVTILWNDGATSEDRTGLSAGTYSVTVTDGGNCEATISVTVNEPAVLGMTGSVTNVTITGGSDGTVSVTVTGGTTPYSYLWSDGATTEDRTGLPAGTYSVTVTDANGCEEEASFTINEPGCSLSLSISAEDALCNGDANGTINLTINGAQGSVQILWNDGATSEDRTGLSAGTYSVTVTDSGNCEATISVTVNEPDVLGMTGSVTNVTITGGSDGTISVTVTGGTTPYSYLWSDGSTSEDRSNLPSGTYTVTVTDANGCSLEQSFTINEPGCALALSITAEDALCNGDANGTIDLTITGAQGSVTILWNDGATSEDRTGLSAGTYSVTVTDSGNCEATISVTVNEPDVLGMTGSVTNVTITGGSDGTISVTVTGGTTPYSYLWSDGSTSEDRTNLTSGNYAVTVTDANGCSLSQSFSINEPGCTLALSIDAEDALCNGDANGTINLTITGAQGSVQILWNDGATSEDRTGLSAGTYSVTVTDSGNCEATISVTVNEPAVLGMTGSVTNVTITGGSDGTISVTVTGGTTPYSYLWSDGSTSEDRTNLTSGNYAVTVTDANGCSLSQSFTINEPGCALALSITAEDALCNGDANGTIDLTITGAQGSVSILWNDGATSEDRTGLSAGTYSVTVTDSGNCEATISVTVNEPAVLGMTGSVTNVTITGGNDGTISVTVTGGTAPYTYLWSDGSTSEDRTNLTSGNYAVTVTDANGCSLSQSFTINEPGCSLSLSISAEDALCNGDANGTINLTITGAQGSVQILWNDGATSEDRTGLSAGTYSVTVTDSGNCEATISVTVNEPDVLGMTGSVTNVTITGGSDGTISVTVTGGTTPYSYLWNDGSTSEDRTNLPSGTYTVTVTDANGCSLSQSFSINEPGCGLSLSITAEDALCNGDANGTIDLTITGAQVSVTILWNDGATSEDRTGLSAGTYSVTVTDGGNCTATIGITVDEPEVLGMTGTVNNVTLTNGSDGSINVTVTGGTTPYTYLWSDGTTTQDRTGLPVGTYSVTVTDANGCEEEASFTITEPLCELLSSGVIVICNDNGTTNTSDDDYFNVVIHPTGNGLGNTYSITGDITANNVSYSAPYQTGINYLISGGNLTITITDDSSNGCQLIDVQITAPVPCSNCPTQICVPVYIIKN